MNHSVESFETISLKKFAKRSKLQQPDRQTLYICMLSVLLMPLSNNQAVNSGAEVRGANYVDPPSLGSFNICIFFLLLNIFTILFEARICFNTTSFNLQGSPKSPAP